MSHRAIVAIQDTDDTYDVHYSANGAHELYLTDILKEHVARGTGVDEAAGTESKTVPRLEDIGAADDIESDSRVEMYNLDKPPIDRDPSFVDVPYDKIGMTFDYDNIEAFYLVRDGRVETFVPAWMEPDVIRPWRDHLTVRVYPDNKLPNNPREMHDAIQTADPVRIINNESFNPPGSWMDDRIVEDIVESYHEYVYAMQRQMVSQSTPDELDNDEESTEVTAFLDLEQYYLEIIGPSDYEITPDPGGRGILIKIPNNNTSRYWRVMDTVNNIRAESGTRLAIPNDITEEDRSEELKSMMIELLKEYANDIAEFSPPPHGPLVKQVKQSLGI